MTNASWELAQVSGVQRAAHIAAARVTRDRGGIVEYDDMRQDALLWVATHPEQACPYVTVTGGAEPAVDVPLLAHRLYSRLLNLTEGRAARAGRTYSFEAIREGARE